MVRRGLNDHGAGGAVCRSVVIGHREPCGVGPRGRVGMACGSAGIRGTIAELPRVLNNRSVDVVGSKSVERCGLAGNRRGRGHRETGDRWLIRRSQRQQEPACSERVRVADRHNLGHNLRVQLRDGQGRVIRQEKSCCAGYMGRGTGGAQERSIAAHRGRHGVGAHKVRLGAPVVCRSS